MTYIDGADYFVRIVDLPCPVGGMVTPNDDGTFSVYINAKNSREKQIKSYAHEVDHIENDDFYTGKDIKEIEKF